MRYIIKISVASVAIASAAFAYNYAAQLPAWSEYQRNYREWMLHPEESLRRGEVYVYCTTPFQQATLCGFYSLLAAPIVLLTGGGIWRMWARYQ